MVFESILDPVFSPLLDLDSTLAIILISAVLTLLTTIIYKITTDQEKLRGLKKDLKDVQKKIKEFSKKNPKKAMDLQKDAMQKNMEYMKHSFKPMIYTFIPIIIIFGWLNAHMAYEPLMPGEPFTVTAFFDDDAPLTTANLTVMPDGLVVEPSAEQQISDDKIVWTLGGPEGTYELNINYGRFTHEQELIISPNKGIYAQPIQKGDAGLKEVRIGNEPLHPFGNFQIFGWHPGWIGTYIIFSLLFSIGFRRILKLA